MKNLVRGGVILLLSSLFVVFIYAQTKTETALNIAKDSQAEINNNVTNTTTLIEEAKLNNDTSSDKGNLKTESAKAAAATSKGSFTATAYCLRGRTATGAGVRRGIVAADPRVLRLGTRINLGAGAYSGSYLVADTGGSVKGRKLDIWMPSCSEARRFGRRTVSVSVLGK